MSDETERTLESLLIKGRRGVLATLKSDGLPQLSNVSYTYDQQRQLLRISVTDSRAKTRNLRRDPRAVFHVTTSDLGAYVVAEGEAELTAVAQAPDDATVDELVEVYRTIVGEHPDWEEFRAAMVAERRLVIRIPVKRTYGWYGWDPAPSDS
ncbi:PPOX class F420-dependent oxidoreductase [Kitasatospora kifunensis]|uniref:PPOX class probable F420-dependent enzyme n=1 Tax=Kitasatospora kifunensis TaxID=58351 RepID=A0A7W7R088_KITKI|nr:PPOX class F420-dependent oxidoreductase [Kitasatospora kifunensis]MBB4922421.1 PPOX class probable F420-dependent enzyme [Kitasatospora kifunensis]